MLRIHANCECDSCCCGFAGAIAIDSDDLMYGLTRFRGAFGDVAGALVACGVLLMVASMAGLHLIRKRHLKLMDGIGWFWILLMVLSAIVAIAAFGTLPKVPLFASRAYSTEVSNTP